MKPKSIFLGKDAKISIDGGKSFIAPIEGVYNLDISISAKSLEVNDHAIDAFLYSVGQAKPEPEQEPSPDFIEALKKA